MIEDRATSYNPPHAQEDWPAVIVAGAFQTGVVLMRDLRRRRVRTFCIDHNPNQPGFRTIYGQAFLGPNPDFEPEQWLRFLLDLARTIGGKPVLIPSADQYVTAISEHAEALADHFTFLPASVAVQSLLATKKRQYSIASDNGLPVPRTMFVSNFNELSAFAEAAQYPCLIKPLHFREWERFAPEHPLYCTKVSIANSRAELESVYKLASELTPQLVVQEIIEGPDTAKMVYLSCYGEGSRRLGGLLLRQMRTHPMSFGSASLVEPVVDPETDRMCDEFLSRIGYRGICELELKRDSRDQSVKLIEVNPRYSVTADAAPYAGIDMGWLHYLDLIGESPHPVPGHGKPFRHIVLKRDFACFRSYIAAGLLSWPKWFWSYRPPVAFFDFDLLDWRLSCSTVVELAKTLLAPIYRRLFPRL